MLNNKSLFLNLILFVSFVALMSAFFIEYVLGHQPCNLCILERIPYVIAIVILKQLQEKKVSCKDVTFKIFGLSLTTYNIVISILITINALKIYLNYAKSK